MRWNWKLLRRKPTHIDHALGSHNIVRPKRNTALAQLNPHAIEIPLQAFKQNVSDLVRTGLARTSQNPLAQIMNQHMHITRERRRRQRLGWWRQRRKPCWKTNTFLNPRKICSKHNVTTIDMHVPDVIRQLQPPQLCDTTRKRNAGPLERAGQFRTTNIIPVCEYPVVSPRRSTHAANHQHPLRL